MGMHFVAFHTGLITSSLEECVHSRKKIFGGSFLLQPKAYPMQKVNLLFSAQVPCEVLALLQLSTTWIHENVLQNALLGFIIRVKLLQSFQECFKKLEIFLINFVLSAFIPCFSFGRLHVGCFAPTSTAAASVCCDIHLGSIRWRPSHRIMG